MGNKTNSFRIINIETGKIKYVGKHIFNDKVLLSQMGFIQQDISHVKDNIVTDQVTIFDETDLLDAFNPSEQIGAQIPDIMPDTVPLKAQTKQPNKVK